MKTSDQINELATALGKAQEAFPDIPKDKTVKVKTKGGVEYQYKYAELSSIVSATRPCLAKNSLSFLQGIVESEKGLICRTRLMHSSGQWVETETPVITDAADMQAMAAAFTYSRRYGLTAILGIATEDDTDGNGADRDNKPKQPQANQGKSQIQAPRLGQTVNVRALTSFEQKELAKKSGFTFSGKSWTKIVPVSELEKHSYPFEIEVVK